MACGGSGQPATVVGGAPPVTAGGWQTQVRRDEGALGDLAAEWRDLHAHCATATPFQSHAWLESWWRFYGRPGRLRLVLVRRHGRLVAGAALLRRRWAGVAVLSPVGYGISDFTDVLLHDECPAEAAGRLAGAIVAEAGAGVVDLPEVRPGAAAWRLAQAWPGGCWWLPASTCLELDAAPIEEVIARLPGRAAKRLRGKLRHIQRHDIDIRYVVPGQVGEAVGRLIELHERQWQGRRVSREHLKPRFAAHLNDAVSHMIADGQALLVEYWRAGRLLGSDVLLVGRRFVGGYLYGIDPDLRQMVDVTTLLFRENLAVAVRLRRPVFNMLRGREAHKWRWRPREAPNQRLILAGTAPARAAAFGYAAAARGRARAVAALDERAPWLRELVHNRGRGGGSPAGSPPDTHGGES